MFGEKYGTPVSTHSRLKAAGRKIGQMTASCISFNTQPPEGGWQTADEIHVSKNVSTHSRLKAAGPTNYLFERFQNVSTHSRLKAAGRTYN